MANSTNSSNLYLYFRPSNDDWKLEEVPMIASTAIVAGTALYAVGDGTHTLATTTSVNFVGILAENIATTDADYATSLKKKKVYVPTSLDAEAEFTVGSGTFTTADIGKSADFASGGKTVAVDTSTTKQMRLKKYISSTRGTCTFNTTIA